MGIAERDFLAQASIADLGIELESAELERDFGRLHAARSANAIFKPLQIRRAANGRIWIIRTNEPLAASVTGPDT